MATRQRIWATKVRAQLIEEMGGYCARCASPFDLEFDHLELREWRRTCRQTSSDHRICIYRHEWERGKLQLLCKKCNTKKGRPRVADDYERG